MKISFVIPTAGKRKKSIELCIVSIIESVGDAAEILLVGNINNIKDLTKYPAVKLVDESYAADNGYVGKLRNRGGEEAKNEILAFCDDDVVVTKDWYNNFMKYNEKDPDWLFLNNKVLLPSGGRFWDRAIMTKLGDHVFQTMKEYEYPTGDRNEFICSCFFVAKRTTFLKIRFNDDSKYYGGGYDKAMTEKNMENTEDVTFSRKVVAANYFLDVDKNNCFLRTDTNNVIWHFTENCLHIHRTEDRFNHDVVALTCNIKDESPHTIVYDADNFYNFFDYINFLYEKYNIESNEENQTYGEKLYLLYEKVLRRKPDIHGYINYMIKNLPIEEVENIFLNSEEYKKLN